MYANNMDQLKPIPVSELNKTAKQLLEDQIGPVMVIGEVSNLMVAKSGHCYFSLKDDSAQISCVFFRHNSLRIEAFHNGDQIQRKLGVDRCFSRTENGSCAAHIELHLIHARRWL